MTKIIYDKKSDCNYISLTKNPIHRTREFRGLVLLNLDKDNKVVDIEFVGDGPVDNDRK